MKKIIILILPFVVLSCNTYYFSEPQPADTKNTYKLPNKYTGSWYIENNKKSHPDDIDSLSVGKDFYFRMTKSHIKESQKKIEEDSNIYFIDNKIYAKEDGKLQGGYDFFIKDDSLIIIVLENKLVEFGRKAFLRKIDYGYILNIKNEDMMGWWEIKFIDTRNKEALIIRTLKPDDLKKNNNHKILHKDFDNYIIAKWTRNDFHKFIEAGGFSDTLLFLEYNKKIKAQTK